MTMQQCHEYTVIPQILMRSAHKSSLTSILWKRLRSVAVLAVPFYVLFTTRNATNPTSNSICCFRFSVLKFQTAALSASKFVNLKLSTFRWDRQHQRQVLNYREGSYMHRLACSSAALHMDVLARTSAASNMLCWRFSAAQTYVDVENLHTHN